MLRVLVATLALSAAACAPTPPAPKEPPRPSMDELRESLRQAELEFAKGSQSRGVDAWLEVFGEDGMLLSGKADVIKGKDAIRKEVTPMLKSKLTWKPTVVEVAPSGEMGFTYGPWEVVAKEGGKEKVVAHGAYMTVWKREAGGTWKVVADMGADDNSH